MYPTSITHLLVLYTTGRGVGLGAVPWDTPPMVPPRVPPHVPTPGCTTHDLRLREKEQLQVTQPFENLSLQRLKARHPPHPELLQTAHVGEKTLLEIAQRVILCMQRQANGWLAVTTYIIRDVVVYAHVSVNFDN